MRVTVFNFRNIVILVNFITVQANNITVSKMTKALGRFSRGHAL